MSCRRKASHGGHSAAEPQPNARPCARARMRHGKLLQQEERCQLTCDGIRLRNGFTASLCSDADQLLMGFNPEQYRVHESAADLAAPFEHEHDDEHKHD